MIIREGVMLPSERLDFSAIGQRPKLALPDGARLAVWVIVNVEEWDPTQPMPRTVLTPPAGGAPMPDIPNWAWHEYGNRVGFWRMLEVLDHFRIRAVLRDQRLGDRALRADRRAPRSNAGGSSSATASPSRACRRSPTSATTSARPQRRSASFTGKHPRGWLGPGLTETWETPDLLVEEGFEYVCDWVLDDQPVVLKTRTKPIVNLPYTQECNDVAMMLIQHHKASEYYDRAIDQFEQLYDDAAQSARIMALVVHPYIMGAPHRLKYLSRKCSPASATTSDVLFWTGEEILDWCLAQSPSSDPPARAEGRVGAKGRPREKWGAS